ncbi:hypothetical protein A3860_32655 [Niastella vici]|uniref:Alpha-N-acetylglucosaminidase n=1 Tax=Niastella vici TaxID=1703345 RepID=A0A1V9FQH1_9BACT|nr:alpha-N-acetylglucosaminidase [Niastella vici]OQP60568.1 hypothetical protein A3860_32655 [Niastella vici]
MRIQRITAIAAVACVIQVAASAQNTTALNALIGRRVPFLNNKVVFTRIPNVQKDTASYYTKGQRLYIQASNTTAAAFALNDYLRTWCGISFSHTGDQVKMPASLPEVRKAIPVAANFRYRYALNYCTYNYTMSFWGWKEWEHELDWMALNGVNLMLAPVGTEVVWQQVLREIGFSEADISAYLPGPAFNAWWLMGNIQGWGGPVSDTMIQNWRSLQQQLLPRMHDLDIQPVLQGFCGLVPSTIKKYFPTARTIDQGSWGKGFVRPVFLLPQDSLFKTIAGKYYTQLRKLYGNTVFLGGDLFHEGGATGNIDLAETAALIQAGMQHYYPGSTWVLQAWQDNPKKELLKGLDVRHTLILDLRGDADNNWERTNGFSGYPWIWCSMVNGGGTLGMEGRLLRILKEPVRAKATAAGRSMVGTGIVPEGIANNDIMYTSLLLAAWQKEINDVAVFLKRYVVARYGKYDADIYNAWQLLLQSAYISHTNELTGAFESIFCARPDSNFIISASTWGCKKLPYDTAIFYSAAACFAKAAARFASSETYRYDLTDLWRQVIALKARQPYAAFMKAWQEHDLAAFKSNAAEFTALLQLQNRWTATNAGFCLRTWLQQAENKWPDEKDKALAVWNAKVQISYWGHSANPETLGHDYANKEWSGLLSGYYLPRWLAFFDYVEKRLQGISCAWPDFFTMEKNWTEQNTALTGKGEDGIAILPEVMRLIAGERP